jgi:hypothetical protein
MIRMRSRTLDFGLEGGALGGGHGEKDISPAIALMYGGPEGTRSMDGIKHLLGPDTEGNEAT